MQALKYDKDYESTDDDPKTREKLQFAAVKYLKEEK